MKGVLLGVKRKGTLKLTKERIDEVSIPGEIS